ncbi:MAG TPA: 30S ribosomal protein S8 [Acidobacteriota bacterium]|jgi:small subunit ribosomal protein S8
MTDPIADLFTRIRNAIRSQHTTVNIPASSLKISVLKILKENGLIENFKVSREKEEIQGKVTVLLKYDQEGRPAITALQRISRPGCRVYLKKKNIQPVLNGLGISIISTSKGLMTGDRATQEGIGGEILANIY